MISAEEEHVISEGVSLGMAAPPSLPMDANNRFNGHWNDDGIALPTMSRPLQEQQEPTNRENDAPQLPLHTGGGSPMTMTMTMAGPQFLPPLQWDDQFFDNDDTEGERGLVIGVFDFDYDAIISYRTSVKNVVLGSASVVVLVMCFAISSLCSETVFYGYYGNDGACIVVTINALALVIVPAMFFLLTCYPCFYRQRIQWDARSQHVAITQDGVLFVRDARRTNCGLRCSNAGRVSKTVPFHKISSCDVTEPAGSWCCCIARVLSEVKIHHSSYVDVENASLQSHSLNLVGLKEPCKFKHVLMTMIRASRAGNDTFGGRSAAANVNNYFISSNAVSGVPVAAVVMDNACEN